MIATIVNACAIILGSFVGLLVKKGMSKRLEEAVYVASGIASLVIGLQMSLKTSHFLALALSLILGGALGTVLDIEGRVNRLGAALKNRFAKNQEGSDFTQGFLTASVLFCSGAMAIIGSFNAGAKGDYSLLFTKSLLDALLSLAFASAMGLGVMFSALSVFAYQGILTLASIWIKDYVSDLMIAELTGLGGALIIMIGINLLNLRKIKTGDFLPAILVIVLLVFAMPYAKFL